MLFFIMIKNIMIMIITTFTLLSPQKSILPGLSLLKKRVCNRPWIFSVFSRQFCFYF